MASKARDLTGQRFSRLIATYRHPENKNNQAQWACACDCGNTTVVIAGSLKSGVTRSCGCLLKETHSSHGLSNSPEYSIWKAMKSRCYYSKNKHYDNYGGRGITVCDEWKDDFEAFYRDMGPRPSPQYSIERDDGNKGYSKDNCRWATKIEQQNNRSNNVFYEHNGSRKTLAQWCRELNLDYAMVISRLKYGWSFEDAISRDVQKTSFCHNGETKSLTAWCRDLNLNYHTVSSRIRMGWSFEEAIQNEKRKQNKAKEIIMPISSYIAYISACSKLAEYNRSYYSEGVSLIPDEEYDRLRKDVIRWETQNPDKTLDISPVFKVGTPVKPENKKEELRHEYRMQSLENALDLDEAETWVNLWVAKYGKDLTVIGEFKYDGMALSLRYVDGSFTRALTRGDGEYGEDVTIHAAKFAPERIEAMGTVEIRGEAFIKRSLLEYMNNGSVDKYANCRNAVAGLFNRNTPGPWTSAITFTPYDIEGPDFTFNSYSDKLEVLKQLGFQSLSCFILSSPYSIHSVFEKVHEIRSKGDIPFDIDGMVFKIDDAAKQIEMGETTHSPRWAFAYKFPPVTGRAKLLDVVFQVGRTGEVAPVAKITATPLLGVVVTSVLLHNEERMRERNIAIGNIYEVWRSGDVIPHMGKMVEEVEDAERVSFPKHCPACGSELVKRGATYYCENSARCPAQLKASIAYAVSRDVLNVDGLAEQTIDLLLKAGLIKRTADIFNLSPADLTTLEGYTEYSAGKLERAICHARETTFDRFIIALGIMDVGKSTARKLAQKLFKREVLFELTEPEKVLELCVEDVGPSTAANIAKYFSDPQKRQDAMDLLKQLVIPEMGEAQPIEGVAGKTFVFTGSFSDTREAYENKVLVAGGFISNSISNKTDYCVAGEKAGSKLRKANMLGIEVLDERVFLSFFENPKHL